MYHIVNDQLFANYFVNENIDILKSGTMKPIFLIDGVPADRILVWEFIKRIGKVI